MGSETFLSKANSKFALALFKKLSEEDKAGNIFYSPFSISAALTMLRLGAAGNTATEISEVLCFLNPETPQPQSSSRLPPFLQKVFSSCSQCLKPQDDEENVDASLAQLLHELNKPKALYALSIANSLYGEQTYTFKQNFVSEAEKLYKAPFQKVDFCNKPDESRETINDWVKKQTQDKITDLLSSDAVKSSTKLVLVNAIYFKGKWEAQFEEESTVDAKFWLNKTDNKTVKMMQQKSKFNYTFNEEANCKILEMPYDGGELSMIILLPDGIEDDTTGLEKLEKELTYDTFVKWTGKDTMQQEEVKVSLPRFKMEESYELNEVLKSMGMEDAFDISKSDFSGMSEANDLVLSKAVHKAFVEVNEEGTEATASTAVVVVERSAMIPETFVADHPFLFFIRHNSSNSVLFAGRFCSPE